MGTRYRWLRERVLVAVRAGWPGDPAAADLIEIRAWRQLLKGT
ncbi:MAG: hypothetical protein KIH64_009265 [Mycobacterium sp.]|nr:hypothetical protein [Mycobacterium sp.]